jgi:hypothetical protein
MSDGSVLRTDATPVRYSLGSKSEKRESAIFSQLQEDVRSRRRYLVCFLRKAMVLGQAACVAFKLAPSRPL